MENRNIFNRVLFIEDNAGHALLIKRALKRFVSEVVHVENVANSMEVFTAEQFDLVVTDLKLPDASGVDHVQRLREIGDDIPIIVLTSSTSLHDAVEAMKYGARDFIVKSFEGDFAEVLGLSLSRVFSSVELERERLRLQKEMEVLRRAIENSNDGLAVITQAGDVKYANSSLLSFLKLCGSTDSNLLSICNERVNKFESLRESLSKNLQKLSDGSVWNTEVTFVDDKERAFDVSLSAMRVGSDANSEGVQEFVIWVRDSSEQKRREKFQREILSTTTHDLKGPMGAIITGAELLSELVSGQQKASELVLRVNSAAHGVVNLIDEFLSARRLEEGNFILRPAEFRAGDLIAGVVDNYSTIAAARSIELLVEVQDDSALVTVDKLGFGRMLGNLISNALKFTPKGGGVTLRMWIDDQVHVQVQDTGSGMEPAEVQRIFERFSRLEKHGEVAGTGIGLFVVRCVVEAHGGNIEVTSKVGEGTTFEVLLPLEPPVNERGELISLDFV